MGKKLYLECNSGISGDMAVALLLDLGADKDVLEKVLSSIPLQGFRTEIKRVKKASLDVLDFNVILKEDSHDCDMDYLFGKGFSEDFSHEPHDKCYQSHHDNNDYDDDHKGKHKEHIHEEGFHDHLKNHSHRTLSEIKEIIKKTQMTESSRVLAEKIFLILAKSEAKAHGLPLEEVTFHEVGGIDSIVDIISLSVCFDNLGIDRVFVPSLFEGSGNVRCQHGLLPIPVPAVLNMVQEYNLPLSLSPDVKGEFITPTGAAFVCAVKTDTFLPEKFTVKKIGMGSGKRSYSRPSILRGMIIEEESENDSDTIYKIEASIDDSSGEELGFALTLLFENGALDASFIPCFMKKNRPSYILCVLCNPFDVEKIERIIFEETSTIGLRKVKMKRTKLKRKIEKVETEWGFVSVKVIDFLGRKKFHPEYEDVTRISKEKNLPFDYVFSRVKEEAKKSFSL